MSTERETEQPKAITRAEMRADLDAMVSKANARQPAPAPSMPPAQPAPAAGTPRTDALLPDHPYDRMQLEGHASDVLKLARTLERENAALTADLAAARAEVGSNTDLPSPTGSVYALKNWWKQQHDVAVERAATLRGALDDSTELLVTCLHEGGSAEYRDQIEKRAHDNRTLLNAPLTVSAGAGCDKLASLPPDCEDIAFRTADRIHVGHYSILSDHFHSLRLGYGPIPKADVIEWWAITEGEGTPLPPPPAAPAV